MARRIAIVSQSYHPAVGGVTEHVDATARELRRRGHEVTIVTARFAGNGAAEPGVVRLGRNLALTYNGAENHLTVGLSLPRTLERVLEDGGFDLVHVHCPLSPVLPLLSLRVARAPIVGTFHSAVTSDFPFRAFRLPLLALYRRIDAPIAVSEVARRDVERHFPGPVRIVPNGVDSSRFRPGLPRLEVWNDDIPNVLFVGRFDPRKGLPELFDAAETLAREGLSFRLILVGDGQLRPYVERRIRGALAGRVFLEGRVAHDRLPRYYATADVFCSPARGGESFGLVLLEAMACGTPIVTTDLPGHRTVVTPDREGLVVPPRDAEALTRALRALLLDPGARGEMGRRGIETARGYGWNRIVDELESTYGALLGGSPKPAAPRPEPAPLHASV